jgi:hypothetical protein
VFWEGAIAPIDYPSILQQPQTIASDKLKNGLQLIRSIFIEVIITAENKVDE